MGGIALGSVSGGARRRRPDPPLGFSWNVALRCGTPRIRLLDFLGIPWILSSESRLINGLREIFARIIFIPAFPSVNEGQLGSRTLDMRNSGIIHTVFLRQFWIIRNHLSLRALPPRGVCTKASCYGRWAAAGATRAASRTQLGLPFDAGLPKDGFKVSLSGRRRDADRCGRLFGAAARSNRLSMRRRYRAALRLSGRCRPSRGEPKTARRSPERP